MHLHVVVLIGFLLGCVACEVSITGPLDWDHYQVAESQGNGHRGRSKRNSLLEEEINARVFLSEYETSASEMCYKTNIVEWKGASDINEENERLKLEQSIVNGRFHKEAWTNITSFNWKTFTDPDLKRKFRLLSVLGPAALSESKLYEFRKSVDGMEKTYSTAKICSFTEPANCELNLEPEITEMMSKSRNYDELKHIWVQWHEQSGRKMRSQYQRFVELSNEAARMNNFSDTAAYWMHDYDYDYSEDIAPHSGHNQTSSQRPKTYAPDHFKADIEGLWQTIKPFYLQLHAYVRAKLSAHYGKDRVPLNAPIPAHLLGNMWAQSWGNIEDLVIPYPGKSSVDVTQEMLKQGYSPLKMFQLSDEFFTSLGLIPMPSEFWQESIIEKPPGREMVCHASAWDFCNGRDFRIKQCTRVNMEDLITVHHEMGHIQYDLQYKGLPIMYRDGANPGFHEAVGDTLALSVQTTRHLKEIGLLDKSFTVDNETTINYLMETALDKLAFFPFAYIMDKWRWDVFDGTVSPADYNCHWWKLREEYQGIRSPAPRSELDFDPGAKYHIAANVEYIRYFVSHIVQFQFYKTLCIAAGQYDPNDTSPEAKPLHECDFYRSQEAGAKLAGMLSMGLSKPWPIAMRAITGQDRMDASAFREYFKPLETWLIRKNLELNATVGWNTDGFNCHRTPPLIVPATNPIISASTGRPEMIPFLFIIGSVIAMFLWPSLV